MKRNIVKQLDELASPKTIIASNSSSFTISEIIDGLELSHPRRCVNLHSCKSTNLYFKTKNCTADIFSSLKLVSLDMEED